MATSDPTLAQRVEAAEGPDRELDAEIAAWFAKAIVRPYPPATDFGPHDRWQFWSRDGEHFLGSEGKIKVEPWTASLDATLALVASKLPGHYPGLYRCIGVTPERWSAWLSAGELPADESEAATPALALLLALLRALESEHG